MFLCIDVGNTRTKAGIFSAEKELLTITSFSENDLEGIQSLIREYNPLHAIVSASGKWNWNKDDLYLPGTVMELHHESKLPIEILYTTPATLGRDRIASACGARALFPGKNILVIDAGTCITMNLLLASGIFLGGNIAPGISMRLKAMHEYTARLPLVSPAFPDLAIGDSTEHALQNGACLGAVMEIEGILNRIRSAYGDVSVVITGGDAGLLAEKLESQIFVAPELVIQGLFQILVLNVA